MDSTPLECIPNWHPWASGMQRGATSLKSSGSTVRLKSKVRTIWEPERGARRRTISIDHRSGHTQGVPRGRIWNKSSNLVPSHTGRCRQHAAEADWRTEMHSGRGLSNDIFWKALGGREPHCSERGEGMTNTKRNSNHYCLIWFVRLANFCQRRKTGTMIEVMIVVGEIFRSVCGWNSLSLNSPRNGWRASGIATKVSMYQRFLLESWQGLKVRRTASGAMFSSTANRRAEIPNRW